jgi:hypothetical protein
VLSSAATTAQAKPNIPPDKDYQALRGVLSDNDLAPAHSAGSSTSVYQRHFYIGDVLPLLLPLAVRP